MCWEKTQKELEAIKIFDDEALEYAGSIINKILPPPVARIIGDLNDRDKVLLGLDLVEIR